MIYVKFFKLFSGRWKTQESWGKARNIRGNMSTLSAIHGTSRRSTREIIYIISMSVNSRLIICRWSMSCKDFEPQCVCLLCSLGCLDSNNKYVFLLYGILMDYVIFYCISRTFPFLSPSCFSNIIHRINFCFWIIFIAYADDVHTFYFTLIWYRYVI